MKYVDDTTIIGCIANTAVSIHTGSKSTVLQIGAQQAIYFSMSAKIKELIVDFRKKEAKTHTLVEAGKRYRGIHGHTTWLQSDFIPMAEKFLNSSSTLYRIVVVLFM